MTAMPSIPDQFRATAAAHADAAAIVFADHVLTFAEVDRASDRVAAGLASLGLAKGVRVGLYCINSAEFAICYLGIVKAGGVVLPVNLLYSPQEVAYVLHDAGAGALICHPAMADRVAALQGLGALPRHCISIGDSAIAGGVTLDALMTADREPPAPQIDPADDLAAILYTSGTTGRPKGAMLTHSNLVANTRSVTAALELRPGKDCLLVVLPMFHAFAATVGMLTPLLHGLRFAPVPRFDPALVTDSIAAVGATVFLGVPSM